MNTYYGDILERINEPPVWWDENAVPRYCEFRPDDRADIYADEVCLYLIECQSCGTEFTVCSSSDSMSRYTLSLTRGDQYPTLESRVEADMLSYGDPPNARCCGAGPTMGSISRRVLQFWTRRAASYRLSWQRMPHLEIDLT